MELSASDIRNRSFSQGLRGLDAQEVHAFLDEVADRWDERARRTHALEERVDTLQARLDEIGDTADKAQTTKERAEEFQEELRTREQRLDEKERELEGLRDRLEAKQTQLRSIAQRLQDALQDETRALSALFDDAAVPPADADSDAEDSTDDESAEEWVDSLFPNRLPKNEPAPTADSPEQTAEEDDPDLSARESQFEAIKQDVQGMQSNGSESPADADETEDEPPPTEEINRIWDVFDDDQP
jgi:DivIVA domain-containing protein